MQQHPTPHARSPLNEWLYYLEHLHNKTIKLGLERVQRIAANLELLTPAATVFIVAGTNGKGTTCRTLEAIILAAGLRVGVYSSPHLIRYTERVRIQGEELQEEEFSRSFAAIEKGRGEVPVSYFEFGTLSALYLFKQTQLDVVILEVGLGGRLDATNIIEPSVALITNIALDHTDWLGNDRDSIGIEKAGIFRNGTPAVVGELDIPASIQLMVKSLGVPLYCNGVAWNYNEQGKHKWQWQSGETLLADLPVPNIPLVNAATALAALHYSSLDISYQAICTGLQQAMLPGRFQFICKEPRLILDVAHNPHAANYLAKSLAQLPRNGGKVRAVVAILSDKDIAGMLSYLFTQVDIWYCAPLDQPRGARIELLTQYLIQPRQFINIKTAWGQAMLDANKQDIIIVCGSFHAVAQVMVALDEK